MRRPKSSSLRRFCLKQVRVKSKKKKRRRLSLKSSKSVRLLTSNRHTLSLKKALKASLLKRGFADIVKMSRNIELLSKVSLIPSTKIKVRLTL